MKTLIIGDLHFKDKLGYSEYIEDGRESERQEILDFIIKESETCDKVVFLGDQFNFKNNTSSVVRKFVNFIERFGDKKLYFIAGNHEKFCDGRSALDFLNEVKGKNWKVISNEIYEEDGYVFCPYFYASELGVETHDEGVKIVMDRLKKIAGEDVKVLFAHHALTNTKVGNIDTSFFSEILLTKATISKLFKQVFLGHIHTTDNSGNIIYAGSIFNNEVGELQKHIWTWEKDKASEIKLPGRSIAKVENPVLGDTWEPSKEDSIVKVIFTKKSLKAKIPEIEKVLKKYDAYIIVERYPHARKKMKDVKGDIADMPVDKLLDLYAEDRKVDVTKLKKGFELITA